MSTIEHDSQPSSDRPLRRPAPHQRRGIRVLFVLLVLPLVIRLTGVTERLFYLPEKAATPAPAQFRDAEKVSFPSSDGEQLVGWFIPAQPTGIRPVDAPTVLHVHGNAGNLHGHIGFSEHLPAAGINLLIFDYRGYGESSGAATRRSALLRDAHAALDYLLTRDDVDPQRIGMFGQSLGGSIGLNLMAERPEIGAAVIVSAFAGWRDIAGDVLGFGPLGRLIAWALISDHLRPDEAIARITQPLLLIHGIADDIVPIAHSRALAANATTADMSLIELPRADHLNLRSAHPEFDSLTIDFFNQRLAQSASNTTGED